MIDKATIQRITDTADIVDVVSDYVHLVRRGANYMGLCPFHNERTPSFSVNQRRNFCYCFSCRKGGSPVNFLMEKEGVSYRDALLMLAKKYGIEVHEKELTDEEQRRRTEREAMIVANEWAASEMHESLLHSEEGRNVGLSYLYQRGVTDEAIKKFRLGYAIDHGNDLASKARAKGFDLNILTELGVLGKSQDGRIYDRFRGRVIFPVFNPSGKVMAFGGRDLKGGMAKYINSPESSLYKKSNELYGIFQAKGDIVRNDKCYLVEGYLDVIGMWQAGLENVVASSGTALTDGQIAVIHRFTDNITLIYDGDAAGIKAALRGIDMLLSHKMNVKVLLLPDGHDPDSFAKAHTAEEFRNFIKENETDIIRFKSRVLLDEAGEDPQKRYLAIKSVVNSLAHIHDDVKRNVYVQECSAILGISEEVIVAETAKTRAALVEQWRREREHKRIDAQQPENHKTAPETGQTVSGQNAEAAVETSSIERNLDIQTPQPSSEDTDNKKIISIVDPDPTFESIQRNVLVYAIRFGMATFCMVADEQGNEYPLKVVEFINDELEIDSLTFSNPLYAHIFNIILDMIEEHDDARITFIHNLEAEISERRRNGFENIALSQLSLSEIKEEERKLEESLTNFRKESADNFSRDYVCNRLVNHEETPVRNFATQALSEVRTLSKIYERNGGKIESEEEKLEPLVGRAMREWKDHVINCKIRELTKRIAELEENGKLEEMMELMTEVRKYHSIRSTLGKSIGDRILKAKLN